METRRGTSLKVALANVLFAAYSGLLFVLQEFQGAARIVVGMFAMGCAFFLMRWLSRGVAS